MKHMNKSMLILFVILLLVSCGKNGINLFPSSGGGDSNYIYKPWITHGFSQIKVGKLEEQYYRGAIGTRGLSCGLGDGDLYFNIEHIKSHISKGRSATLHLKRTTKDVKTGEILETKPLTFELKEDDKISLNLINTCEVIVNGGSNWKVRSAHRYSDLKAEFIDKPTEQELTNEPVTHISCLETCKTNLCLDTNINALIPQDEYKTAIRSLEDMLMGGTDIKISNLHSILKIDNKQCSISDFEFHSGKFNVNGNNCAFRTDMQGHLSAFGSFPEYFTLLASKQNGLISIQLSPSIPIDFSGKDDELANALKEKFISGITHIELSPDEMYLGSNNECMRYFY